MRVYLSDLVLGGAYRVKCNKSLELRVVIDISKSDALLVRIPVDFYYTKMILGEKFRYSDLVFNTIVHNRFILSRHPETNYLDFSKTILRIDMDLDISEISHDSIRILEKRENRTVIEEWNLFKLQEFYLSEVPNFSAITPSISQSLINEL